MNLIWFSDRVGRARQFNLTHPATLVILAALVLSILGMDFLLYVLFQWTYGDRRRRIARKVKRFRNEQPFLVRSKQQNLR